MNALIALQIIPEPSSDLAPSHSPSPLSHKSPLPEGTNGTLTPRRAAPRSSNPSIPLLAPQSIFKTRQSSQTPSPNLKSLALQFLTHSIAPNLPPPPPHRRPQKVGEAPLALDLTNDFDPFTKLNLNSSLDRANSKTYNPWEMISRLQTIAKTVPFHPKLYKRSPVNRSPGILTETITASLLQGNHRMNSARLQV